MGLKELVEKFPVSLDPSCKLQGMGGGYALLGYLLLLQTERQLCRYEQLLTHIVLNER